MREDMTSFIDRLPIVEERLGISLAGLYAYGDGKYIHVNGEIRSADTLDDDLLVVANLYDAGGRMLGVIEHDVAADNFMGFDSFSMLQSLDEDQPHVTRILLFVKKL
jgi:hypothetical protein